MANANSIAPFPDDIDREAFGHWLSGFVDGEGCFNLCLSKGQRTSAVAQWSLTIKLRADDAAILLRIQSFFGCGRFGTVKKSPDRSRRGEKPAVIFQVQRTAELAEIIIPHFERFPLRAKKAGSFRIWREGIELLYDVARRRGRPRQDAHGRLRGNHTKWSVQETGRFLSLVNALKRQHRFDPLGIPVSPPQTMKVCEPSLYDSLA